MDGMTLSGDSEKPGVEGEGVASTTAGVVGARIASGANGVGAVMLVVGSVGSAVAATGCKVAATGRGIGADVAVAKGSVSTVRTGVVVGEGVASAETLPLKFLAAEETEMPVVFLVLFLGGIASRCLAAPTQTPAEWLCRPATSAPLANWRQITRVMTKKVVTVATVGKLPGRTLFDSMLGHLAYIFIIYDGTTKTAQGQAEDVRHN